MPRISSPAARPTMSACAKPWRTPAGRSSRPSKRPRLKAGSVVIYSHNLFHRGNHRRDDWRTWKDRRALHVAILAVPDDRSRKVVQPDDIDWNAIGIDPMTGVDLGQCAGRRDGAVASPSHTGFTPESPPTPRPETRAFSSGTRKREAQELFARLHAPGDVNESRRIGAAYKLASNGDAVRRHPTAGQGAATANARACAARGSTVSSPPARRPPMCSRKPPRHRSSGYARRACTDSARSRR